MNTHIEQTLPSVGTVPTRETILALLRRVQEPHSGLDLVTLGWVGEVTVVHPQVIVALHPAGRICATDCAIETAIGRMLQPHLGTDQLQLRMRWDTDWRPDDE